MKTWDQLVDEGRRLVAEDGDIKFKLGDLALEVESQQGARSDLSEHSEKSPLAQFSDDVGVSYQRLMEYRQVAEAWPPSKRSASAPWVVHLRFKGRDDRFDLIANPPESVDRRTGEITRRWTDTLAQRELGATLPNRTPDQRTPEDKRETFKKLAADPDVADDLPTRAAATQSLQRATDRQERRTDRDDQTRSKGIRSTTELMQALAAMTDIEDKASRVGRIWREHAANWTAEERQTFRDGWKQATTEVDFTTAALASEDGWDSALDELVNQEG